MAITFHRTSNLLRKPLNTNVKRRVRESMNVNLENKYNSRNYFSSVELETQQNQSSIRTS